MWSGNATTGHETRLAFSGETFADLRIEFPLEFTGDSIDSTHHVHRPAEIQHVINNERRRYKANITSQVQVPIDFEFFYVLDIYIRQGTEPTLVVGAAVRRPCRDKTLIRQHAVVDIELAARLAAVGRGFSCW